VSPLTEGPAEQRSHYRRNLLIVSGGLALLGFAWWGFKVWIHRPPSCVVEEIAEEHVRILDVSVDRYCLQAPAPHVERMCRAANEASPDS